MRRLTTTLAAAAVAAGLVTAPAAPASAALAAKVRVVDNDFRPVTVTVPVGSTVGWLNRGVLQHSVTFDDGFDVTIATGERTRRRFRDAGTYAYVCKFHFGMEGEVVVTN